MNTNFFATLMILGAGISIAHAADAGATEALQQRVLAFARTVTAEDYSFTRTARAESTEGSVTKERVLVERYDPRKPIDQRWTFVSVDGRAPTADEQKSHDKELPKRRVTHYGRIAAYIGSPAIASTEGSRTVLRFTSLPSESLVVRDIDLSASAVGEADVDTSGPVPFVERMKFTIAKPTRVKLIARIERFEATTRYRMMPDGKPAPVEQVSDITGSMLGKSGRIKTTLTYTDVRPARD